MRRWPAQEAMSTAVSASGRGSPGVDAEGVGGAGRREDEQAREEREPAPRQDLPGEPRRQHLRRHAAAAGGEGQHHGADRAWIYELCNAEILQKNYVRARCCENCFL